MNWIYLSHKISENTPLYNDSGAIEIDQYRKISLGDTCNNTKISMPVHSGSHIDAPAHFDDLGNTIDNYSPDFWISNNPAMIEINCKPGGLISLDMVVNDLEAIPEETDILLFKTGTESWRGDGTEKYTKLGIGLEVTLCDWIRENLKLKFIGLDFISLSSPIHSAEGRAAHQALLSSKTSIKRPVLIIEDLSLEKLEKTPSSIISLPLQIEKSDGAMAIVIAKID